MAKQTVPVGNANIVLTDSDDPFNDRYTAGYLEFYDERHRPLFLLTNCAIRDHLLMIINEASCSDLWNVGRVTGWIEALIENNPQTFRSLAPRNR